MAIYNDKSLKEALMIIENEFDPNNKNSSDKVEIIRKGKDKFTIKTESNPK